MKRIFALTFALLLVFSLAACGGDTSVTPTAGNDIDIADATTEATEAGIVFEELVVYESDTMSIVVTGVDPENPSGYALSLTVSNNMEAEEIQKIEYVYETNDEGEREIVEEIEYYETVSTTLACVLETIKVNGTQIELSFNSHVDSGSRNYDQIILDPALIDGLGDITEIELTFRMYDTSKADETIATATGIVYPYGNDASEAA